MPPYKAAWYGFSSGCNFLEFLRSFSHYSGIASTFADRIGPPEIIGSLVSPTLLRQTAGQPHKIEGNLCSGACILVQRKSVAIELLRGFEITSRERGIGDQAQGICFFCLVAVIPIHGERAAGGAQCFLWIAWQG